MENVNQNNIVKKLAVTGALGALTIVLGLTHLGFIPWISGASITILHVPAIIASLVGGLASGVGVGAIFGIYSLIQAAIAPVSIFDPYFVNPLVSVLPRVCIGVVTFFVARGMDKICSKKTLNFAIASFLGSFTNTALVIGALALLKVLTRAEALAIITANAFLEAGAAVVICTAVSSVWFKLSQRNTSKLVDNC